MFERIGLSRCLIAYIENVMMVHTFSDKAHNHPSLASLRSETPECILPSDADAKAFAKVTLFQAPSSVRSVFYRMLVNLSWPVLVCHPLLTISRIKFSLPS